MNAVRKPPRDKKCRYSACGKPFTPKRSLQVVCETYQCALGYERQCAEKRARRARAVDKRVTRVRLDELKTLAKLCVEAQRPVNLFVRARDYGLGCISCETGRVEQAGHFFPIGSKWRCHRLRFDTRLIHGQCVQCNHSEGGNVHGYIEGIKRRFGPEKLEEMYAIKAAAERGELVPLTREEVREIKQSHWRMGRELAKANGRAHDREAAPDMALISDHHRTVLRADERRMPKP